MRKPELKSERAQHAREVIRTTLANFASVAWDSRVEAGLHKFFPVMYPDSVRAVRVAMRSDHPDLAEDCFDVLMVEDPEVWVKIKPHALWGHDGVVEWWLSHGSIHLHESECYDQYSSHDKIVWSVIRGLVQHCIGIAEAEGTIT